MLNKIRLADLELSPEEINDIHFRLMNQQCPVHLKTPYVVMTKRDIQYTCCCEKLRSLCLMVVSAHKKK